MKRLLVLITVSLLLMYQPAWAFEGMSPQGAPPAGGTGDVTGITAGDAIRVDNGATATPDVHVDMDENTTDLEGTVIAGADVVIYQDSDNGDDIARGLVSDMPFLINQTIGIADNNLLEVDGSPNSGEIPKFTANGLEGRTEGEFKSDYNMESGTDYAATTVVTDSLGSSYDTEAELIALMSIAQVVSLEGAEVLTPTAAYYEIDIALTCEDASTAITVGETGAISNATSRVRNVSGDGNECTIAFVTNNFEFSGGVGTTLIVDDDDYFEMQYTGTKWKVTVNQTSTQWISSLASMTPVTDDADDFDNAGIFSDTVNMYGGTFIADGTGTANLPVMAVGMNGCIITLGAIAVIVDTNAADGYLMDGTTGTEGKNATNTSTAGDILCFQYYTADDWLFTTNGWTPE